MYVVRPPGTFFFLFGLCHTVAIYRRYFRALYSQQSPGYHSKGAYTHYVCRGWRIWGKKKHGLREFCTIREEETKCRDVMCACYI